MPQCQKQIRVYFSTGFPQVWHKQIPDFFQTLQNVFHDIKTRRKLKSMATQRGEKDNEEEEQKQVYRLTVSRAHTRLKKRKVNNVL